MQLALCVGVKCGFVSDIISTFDVDKKESTYNITNKTKTRKHVKRLEWNVVLI